MGAGHAESARDPPLRRPRRARGCARAARARGGARRRGGGRPLNFTHSDPESNVFALCWLLGARRVPALVFTRVVLDSSVVRSPPHPPPSYLKPPPERHSPTRRVAAPPSAAPAARSLLLPAAAVAARRCCAAASISRIVTLAPAACGHTAVGSAHRLVCHQYYVYVIFTFSAGQREPADRHFYPCLCGNGQVLRRPRKDSGFSFLFDAVAILTSRCLLSIVVHRYDTYDGLIA